MIRLPVYLGIDPASHLMGVAWIDGTGAPLAPLPTPGRNPAFQTLKARASDNRHKRLTDLHEALTSYVTYFLIQHNTALDTLHAFDGRPHEQIFVAAIGLEEPSDRFKQDSHTTPFVNGMSFRTVYLACQDIMRYIHYQVPIYELKPGASSESLGLSKGSAKRLRCERTSQLGQGRYTWKSFPDIDAKDVGSGWCAGGMLDGASSDALDALAVAYAARAHHINQIRIAEALHDQQPKRRPGKRKPGSP